MTKRGEWFNHKVKEYCSVRFETCTNNAQIARELKKAFDLEEDTEAIRTSVSRFRIKLGKKEGKTIKRLFFDIETSPMIGWFWRTGKQYVDARQIQKHKRIICISYKWQYEDKVHTLKWSNKQSDRSIVKKFIKILGEADEIVAHNGDRFDIKEIRTRAIKEGVLMFPKYRTFDTLKKARKYFNFNSNRLDYLGEVLKVGRKLDHEGIDLWLSVLDDDKDALQRMIDYCEQDVILLEDVFHALSPYIDHNTNHSVQNNKGKANCPNCASEKVKLSHTDTTPMGYIKRHMKCGTCRKQYPVSNKTYLAWLTK